MRIPAGAPPKPDEEIHGQEHKLKKQEEQEEIEGNETAHDCSR